MKTQLLIGLTGMIAGLVGGTLARAADLPPPGVQGNYLTIKVTQDHSVLNCSVVDLAKSWLSDTNSVSFEVEIPEHLHFDTAVSFFYGPFKVGPEVPGIDVAGDIYSENGSHIQNLAGGGSFLPLNQREDLLGRGANINFLFTPPGTTQETQEVTVEYIVSHRSDLCR